jgi:hypothetical protein
MHPRAKMSYLNYCHNQSSARYHNSCRESKGGYKIEVSHTTLKGEDNIKNIDLTLCTPHKRVTNHPYFRFMLLAVMRVHIHKEKDFRYP